MTVKYSCVQPVLGLSQLFGPAADCAAAAERMEPLRVFFDDALRGVRRNGVVRWAMITKAAPQIDGPRVTLRQDGKVLFLEQDGALQGAWQAQPAAGPNSWDSSNTGCTQLFFTVTAPASGEVDIAVRFSTGDTFLILFR